LRALGYWSCRRAARALAIGSVAGLPLGGVRRHPLGGLLVHELQGLFQGLVVFMEGLGLFAQRAFGVPVFEA